MAAGGMGSVNNPKDLVKGMDKYTWTQLFSLLSYLGLRIAGQSSLRKMNPETTLVLTKRSLGHFCITSL